MRTVDLTVRYALAGGARAVDGVSLSVDAGELVGVSGPSGCGKTSLALAIMGLLGGEVTVSGAIELDGRDLRGLTDREWAAVRGKDAGIVFQESALALNPLRAVGEQIADVVRSHEPCDRRTARDRARVAMSDAGFGDDLDRIYRAYPHTLSGGQRQRILIAQAIVCRPKLIIADEPIASLDDESREDVLRLISRLNEEQRVSFLLITHSARVLATTASRVIEMDAGRIVHDGAPPRASLRRRAATLASSGSIQELHRPAVLEVAGLEKSYTSYGLLGRRKHVIPALRGIDLTIERGATVGLTGPSGCGKSTLARCLAGLEPADAGRICVGGEAQLVFQDSAAALNPRFTALEIVTEAMVIRRVGSAADRRERAAGLMTQVGLSAERLGDRPGEFSGGERQRLAIARALAVSPALLVLDEAFSGLDVATRARIVGLLLSLQASQGLTYLCISHDLDLLAELTTDVVVMHDGRIVEREQAGDGLRADVAPNAIPSSPTSSRLAPAGAAV